MEQNSNITQVHGVTPQELKESILSDVRTELKEIVLNFQPKKQSEYLTRKEVAKILKVSLVTLTDWNKKGVLKPYRLGNLIRYKRVELDQALISINSKKR
jgi:excisionase family DNA binding protein